MHSPLRAEAIPAFHPSAHRLDKQPASFRAHCGSTDMSCPLPEEQPRTEELNVLKMP